MKSVNANKINRKSGEAEGSAVLFPPRPLLEVFFDRARSGELALSEVEGDLRFLLPGSRDDKYQITQFGNASQNGPRSAW